MGLMLIINSNLFMLFTIIFCRFFIISIISSSSIYIFTIWVFSFSISFTIISWIFSFFWFFSIYSIICCFFCIIITCSFFCIFWSILSLSIYWICMMMRYWISSWLWFFSWSTWSTRWFTTCWFSCSSSICDFDIYISRIRGSIIILNNDHCINWIITTRNENNCIICLEIIFLLIQLC